LVDFETFTLDRDRGSTIGGTAAHATGIAAFPGPHGRSRYPALGIASACRPTRKETDEE